jgi:hypothetical protein
MKKIHLITQDVITRGIDVEKAAKTINASITRLDLSRWREHIEHLEREVRSNDERPLIFCSLQVAGYIRHCCPTLARGVLLPEKFLHHHNYSSVLPAQSQLNSTGIYLPWGKIPKMHPALQSLYPGGVFVRPDSPLKPFTGFALEHDTLLREHAILSQAARTYCNELCYIDHKRTIPETEYRVWLVDSTPVTAASYGWTEGTEGQDIPDDVMMAAAKTGVDLDLYEQILTADFVRIEGEVKLVELNAISTSGWYSGMDPASLLQSLEPMLV